MCYSMNKYKFGLMHSNSYHMYVTTRYNFVHLKAMHKISPLDMSMNK